jgi:hypothetical protein
MGADIQTPTAHPFDRDVLHNNTKSPEAFTTMNGTAQTQAFTLAWSLRAMRNGDANSPAHLQFDFQLEAREEVFIADKLWDFDSSNQRIPDRFGVYRFVHEGTLRLLFGQAPRPSNILPRVIYAPLYSRIRAGEVHQKSLLLTLPVDEFESCTRHYRTFRIDQCDKNTPDS